MSILLRIGVPHALKWVSLTRPVGDFTSSKCNFYVHGSFNLVQQIGLYGTESSADSRNGLDFAGNGKKARAIREQAQSALVEYFHLTRSFRIMDAENMSKNAPQFFDRLMKSVDIEDGNIRRSMTRFLRYHPVNEFEPFFESIGLKPSEYVQYLPRNLMFLADDELLLENYYVLCNYGIERNRIGKIFKEVNEVFQYEYGALQAKLRSLEDLGLNQLLVAKIVASSPRLMRGNVGDFVAFLEKLKKVGIGYDWLQKHIQEEDSYNWKCMVQLMDLFCKFGWGEKQVGDLFEHHPDLLLECSGLITFGLIGVLLKWGSTLISIQNLFLQFPQIPVLKFAYNLHNSYNFLVESNMSPQDICHIVCSYPVLLGSIEIKKVKSVLSLLNCGKNKLCQMIKDDPFTLEGWVLGKRVKPLTNERKAIQVKTLKTQFLLSLGFEKDSKDMEKALKSIRGKGEELQQRFDILVNNGLTREEAIEMIRVSAQILNQTGDVIETKIHFFVNDLGYQVSDLLTHPKALSYTIQRLKLRLSMYKWLKDQGAVRPDLCLSTLLSCSDEEFIRSYVTLHAKGPAFWKSLKKKLNPIAVK